MQPKINTCTNLTDLFRLFSSLQDRKPASSELDIYSYKQKALLNTLGKAMGERGTVGLPLQLAMYQQLPLWAGFFESIGFGVTLSKQTASRSNPDEHTASFINTFCYPARIMNDRIESLLSCGADFVFLPCESFEINEFRSSDQFNCSQIAYYPELLRVCNDKLNYENFVTPYIDLNLRKSAVNVLYALFKGYGIKKREISNALNEGFARLETYRSDVKTKADEILYKAEKQGRYTVILAGRPYYIDNEINHGINKLLLSRGFAVLSEDSICAEAGDNTFNQWTNRARLYRAAEFAADRENVFLVHLTSSGCKYDEIISGELSAIARINKKPYIRINLDETAARIS